MYRQGDILLVPIKDVPQDVKPIEREGGRIVLAKGESTGHAHVVEEEDVEFVLSLTGKRILISRLPFTLRHEEHSTLQIPAGAFEVVRQREYTPQTPVVTFEMVHQREPKWQTSRLIAD